jgi:hypothetical protein
VREHPEQGLVGSLIAWKGAFTGSSRRWGATAGRKGQRVSGQRGQTSNRAAQRARHIGLLDRRLERIIWEAHGSPAALETRARGTRSEHADAPCALRLFVARGDHTVNAPKLESVSVPGSRGGRLPPQV